MNYYLWVDGCPNLWWVAKGKTWNNLAGVWFFDRCKWLSKYPGYPDKNPGALMTKNQVVKITQGEACKIILSPTKEVIKPILNKYDVDTEKFDWISK